MRRLLIAVPLLLAAAPLSAQTAPPTAAERQIPPELSDPATADKLARMLGPLAKALMDMPVGELEAAIAGREPTAADKSKRMRDELGPEGQKDLEASLANAGPRMRAMQKALVASLPSIIAALSEAEKSLERATANLPDPTYPKR